MCPPDGNRAESDGAGVPQLQLKLQINLSIGFVVKGVWEVFVCQIPDGLSPVPYLSSPAQWVFILWLCFSSLFSLSSSKIKW